MREPMTDDTKTTDALESIKVANPLLNRLNKLPGTTIRLPSKNLFYTNGEIDAESVDGEVQLFPMTATDEIMMRSIDMLFQGTAIENVIRRCLPQIKKPLELLVGDIDYILTQLRKVSYGANIPITYDCDCITDPKKLKEIADAGDNEYMVPVEYFIQNTKDLDAKDFARKFNVVLSTGEHVTLQPLRFSDFIKIQQLEDVQSLKDMAHIEEYVATNFTAVTLAVDEVTDKQHIKEWYKRLPRLETEKIKSKINSMENWGIEFKYTITCKHCKKKKELKTQLNPMYFFTQPSSPETKTQ